MQEQSFYKYMHSNTVARLTYGQVNNASWSHVLPLIKNIHTYICMYTHFVVEDVSSVRC